MSLTRTCLVYSLARMVSVAANGGTAALEVPGVAIAARVVHAGGSKFVLHILGFIRRKYCFA